MIAGIAVNRAESPQSEKQKTLPQITLITRIKKVQLDHS